MEIFKNENKAVRPDIPVDQYDRSDFQQDLRLSVEFPEPVMLQSVENSEYLEYTFNN